MATIGECGHSRSPSLPPLTNHGSPDGIHAWGTQRRRFSRAEQQAFGRHSVAAICGRRSSMTTVSRASRSASQPNLRSEIHLPTHSPASRSAVHVDGSTSESPEHFNRTKVQAVLDQLLPAGDEDRHSRPSSVPSVSSSSSHSGSLRSRRGCAEVTHSTLPPTSGKFSSKALKCYRRRLLEHFHSLHDAFSSQLRSTSWEVVLGAKEMRNELSRISDDADELFASSGLNWHGGMSLASFFYKLVSSSPESLLWELRCRLTSSGLWRHGNLQLTELAKRLSHESIKACSNGTAIEMGDDALEMCCAPMSRISHEAWLQLSIAIGLTNFEAHKLHEMLCDEISHEIEFSRMRDVLRVFVAPDASAMQFAADMLDQYGSLRDAFRANCASEMQVMRFDGFCKVAASLDVSERNARKLWTLLMRGLQNTSAADGDSPDSTLRVTEDQFVEHYVTWSPDILPWAPNVALRVLDRQINQKFASFIDCRRALRQHGLPSSQEISPLELRDGLTAIGVLRCDTDVLLAKVRDMLKMGSAQRVTFDDVVETLRTSWQNSPRREWELAAGGLQTWHSWNMDKHTNQLRRNCGSCPSLSAHLVCGDKTQQSPSVSPVPSLRRSSSPAKISRRTGSPGKLPRTATLDTVTTSSLHRDRPPTSAVCVLPTPQEDHVAAVKAVSHMVVRAGMETPPEVLSRRPSRVRGCREDAMVTLPKVQQEVADSKSAVAM